MFHPVRLPLGKSFYVNTKLFLLLFPHIGQCLQFLQFYMGEVICVHCIIMLTVIHMQAENIRLKLILILYY
jgi:hypothetical protein